MGLSALDLGRSLRSGMVVCVGFSAVLYLVAPWLIGVWTHGRIQIQPALLGCLLVYATVAGIWNVPRVLLMACNQHMGLATLVPALSTLMLVHNALAWRKPWVWQVWRWPCWSLSHHCCNICLQAGR